MSKLTSLMTLAVAVILFGAVSSAQATKIEYTLSSGTLNFTVINDTLASPITSFDISFGVTTDGLNFTNTAPFSTVSDGSGPAGWTTMAFAPTTLDNPWVYTGFVDPAGGPGVAVGGSKGVFTTHVTLAGTASLDHLWFNVYDDNFDTLGSGFTRQASGVPEPGTFLLLGAGLAGLSLYRRKKA